jgi:hypothetical protein
VTRGESMLEQGGFVAYVALLGVAGAVLALSMPWATQVEEFRWFPWRPLPILFFSVYAFMASSVALNRGAALAPAGAMRWRQLVSALTQTLVGHAICVPYFLYARVLMPGREMTIPMVVAYAVLVSFAAATYSYARHAVRWSQGVASQGTHYILLAVVFGLPLLATLTEGPLSRIALLSPVGAVQLMLSGGERAWLSVAFAIPAATGLFLLLWIVLRMRRWSR